MHIECTEIWSTRESYTAGCCKLQLVAVMYDSVRRPSFHIFELSRQLHPVSRTGDHIVGLIHIHDMETVRFERKIGNDNRVNVILLRPVFPYCKILLDPPAESSAQECRLHTAKIPAVIRTVACGNHKPSFRQFVFTESPAFVQQLVYRASHRSRRRCHLVQQQYPLTRVFCRRQQPCRRMRRHSVTIDIREPDEIRFLIMGESQLHITDIQISGKTADSLGFPDATLPEKNDRSIVLILKLILDLTDNTLDIGPDHIQGLKLHCHL